MSRMRIAVAALSLSAAAFIGLVSSESYTEMAVIPVQGDRPTAGFGSTRHVDGAPVKMGDRLDPVRALITAQAHIAKDEAAFRSTLDGAKLSQAEYDVYLDWTYQYGIGAWRSSAMRTHILAEEYRSACDALISYRFITSPTAIAGWQPYKFDAAGRPVRWRFDCSAPGNKVCPGVWTRQQERHRRCLGAQ